VKLNATFEIENNENEIEIIGDRDGLQINIQQVGICINRIDISINKDNCPVVEIFNHFSNEKIHNIVLK